MSDLLRVFIGYDSQEPVTFSVLAYSILKRASRPLAITPLVRSALGDVYTRPRTPTEATEFSLTRFLVPYLSGYAGYSLFLDCDMVVRTDLWDLLLYPAADPGRAVYVCQHDYVPRRATKFEGHVQTRYPMKNWSSFCLFDNAKCRALTPAYVNTATGLQLHRFQWLPDPSAIGSLPLTWNWLVGEYEPNPDARVYHYTNGSPCFEGFVDCDHADLWWADYQAMRAPLLGTPLVAPI